MNERGFGPAFFFVQDGEAIGPRQHPRRLYLPTIRST